jgi:uncharacterized repeat protein (TIGR01451 family)
MKLRSTVAVISTCSFLTLLAAGAAENPWYDLGQLPQKQDASKVWIKPDRFRAVGLDDKVLQGILAEAKLETDEPVEASPAELVLPLPDGSFGRFRIVESPVMEPGLVAKFPEIRTYLGQGVDDPTATARLDWTPAGFHAQVLSARGAVYVDPAFREDVVNYVCYDRKDLSKGADFHCLLPGVDSGLPKLLGNGLLRSSGTIRRSYRLACAATGEYTAYHGGTVAAAQAAIVTAVNRVVGVYEREVAIRMVLVANNSSVVYTSSGSDPYSNSDGPTMLGQNQANLDSVIGNANYDIGHVFSTGGGGIASLGSVCVSSRKGQGVTGSTAPTGDAFWIDYVAHEMGHQFGANHCFNSTTGSCSGNRNSSTAYEPGSSSTIMGYAGICGSDNLQAHSDAYFHATSFDEIVVFSTAGSGAVCPTTAATGNSVPTVNAGPAYTIPRSTPFTLTATGSDANGDALTYCWEEMDLGVATTLTAADNGSSPILRSFNPTNSPSRTFPKWSDILNNVTNLGEKLPTTSRTMKFRVTVRDNRAGGGGVNTSDTTVTSVSTAGPFVITSPNTAGVRSNLLAVTWNVAGTTNAPINATNVNILLSTNGGSTFSILLVSNTPNDGAESVLLPNLTTTTARLKVEARGNIFFDVSNTNFTVVPGASVVDVAVDSATLVAEDCPTGYVDPGETVTMNIALRNSGTKPTTNLVVTLLATNGFVLCSAPQAYGALTLGGPAVSRPYTFTATGACGGVLTARLLMEDGATNYGTLSLPIALGAGAGLVTNGFTNSTLVSVPGSLNAGQAAAADPYPSTLEVAGVPGPVAGVTVTLHGLTHSYPDDLDVLLVGPGGQSVLLLSDAGGGTDVAGLTLTFSANAATALGDSTTLTSGTWLPSNFGSTADSFSLPAPGSPYGTNLTVFKGLEANGTWSLYLVDDGNGDDGSLAQGWSLSIAATNLTCCTSSSEIALGGAATASAITLSNTVTFAFGVTNLGPSAALEVTLSDDLPAGFSVLSVDSSQGGYEVAGNLITAHLGALAAGNTATVNILARGILPGNWTNQPAVSLSSNDPLPGNNSLSLPVAVIAEPELQPLLVAGGQVSLTWGTTPGLVYRVQYKDALDQPDWTTLGPDLPATGATLNATDPAPGPLARFYRIMIVP